MSFNKKGEEIFINLDPLMCIQYMKNDLQRIAHYLLIESGNKDEDSILVYTNWSKLKMAAYRNETKI